MSGESETTDFDEIFMGKNIPKKVDKNILIIHNKKVFLKYLMIKFTQYIKWEKNQENNVK